MSLLLELLQRRQLPGALLVAGGEDHGAHVVDALGGEEHVLRAAQADSLGTEFTRLGGVLGCFGVGAHLQAPVLVGPGQQGLEIVGGAGLDLGHIAEHDLAGGAVEGDHVAAADHRAVLGGGGARRRVDAQRIRSR
jgi:hypothetical protein